MTTPPDNIRVFAADSDEYVSFCKTLPSGFGGAAGGTLIKYNPCGRAFKIAVVTLLPLFTAACCFIPDVSTAFGLPLLPLLFGAGTLVVLWALFNSRFEEAWFLLLDRRLVVKRWRYIVPGVKIATFDKQDMRSVKHVTGPKVPKAPRSYTVQAELRHAKAPVDIMTELDYGRTAWLAQTLSAWRKGSGGWQAPLRRKNGAKASPPTSQTDPSAAAAAGLSEYAKMFLESNIDTGRRMADN